MKTILCIDDDRAGLAMRKMMLESEGYKVFTGKSGTEGLALLETEKIDAVILDYRMPAMDGAEVARHIREKWPHIPVVMLSGYPDDVPEAAIHLVDAFVTKGDGPEQLLQVVESNLQGRTSGRVTILNVDDNDQHRYAISRVLREAGYHVIEARTGREALQLACSRPGLVILDINLPDMLGFDVCRRLKSDSLTADIPVIHVSATYPSPTVTLESKSSGANRFIEQPANLDDLLKAVDQELRKTSRSEMESKRL